MELVPLGTGAAYAGPGHASSGYLVRDGDTGLLIDCGNGVVSRLLEAGEQDNLTALLFTHLHADHCLDVFSLFYSRVFAKGKSYARLPLYLPPGELERFARLAEVLRVEPAKLFERTFDPTEYDPEKGLTVGSLQLSFVPTEHPVPTFAVRVDGGDASLVFSADTGPSAEVERLARGCDLLLCEASLAEEDFDPARPIHLTPRLAAELAVHCQARRLLLTHLWPHYNPAEMLDQARQVFPNTVLAEELSRYPVS